MLKTHWIVHFEWVNFMTCELYLNKVVKNNRPLNQLEGERLMGPHTKGKTWSAPCPSYWVFLATQGLKGETEREREVAVNEGANFTTWTIFLNCPLECWWVFPSGSWVTDPPTNAGDARLRFSPWVGKTPWRRARQPTPAFLPGESHGQRSLAGYSPWGHKELNTTEQLNNDYKVMVTRFQVSCPGYRIEGNEVKVAERTRCFSGANLTLVFLSPYHLTHSLSTAS